MEQTKLKITELKELMLSVCKKNGLTVSESNSIIENYLEAETLGKTTHGLSKFCFESQFFHERKASPIIKIDTGPLLKLNGNKEVGPIAAEFVIELAAQRAKKHGVCILGINNIQRYGVLRTWIRKITNKGLFGIVMNTCEPAMTGYLGKKKVFGTNPISFPLQTKNENYIVDMATSKVAMSNIWKAKRENTELAKDTFLDAAGNLTTNPDEAKSVLPYGGIKGSNLALLIQLLSGSVFGFKMASEIRSIYDIGYVFLVIDPEKTTSSNSYLLNNQKLVDELRKSGAVIPGSRSTQFKLPEEILINTEIYHELLKLRGEENES